MLIPWIYNLRFLHRGKLLTFAMNWYFDHLLFFEFYYWFTNYWFISFLRCLCLCGFLSCKKLNGRICVCQLARKKLMDKKYLIDLPWKIMYSPFQCQAIESTSFKIFFSCLTSIKQIWTQFHLSFILRSFFHSLIPINCIITFSTKKSHFLHGVEKRPCAIQYLLFWKCREWMYFLGWLKAKRIKNMKSLVRFYEQNMILRKVIKLYWKSRFFVVIRQNGFW
jgi:hypothetical protein